MSKETVINSKESTVVDFSKITSSFVLERIIKKLCDPKLVLIALHRYVSLSQDESSKLRSGHRPPNNHVAQIVSEIEDNRTFMLAYPSVIEEFYLNAKNPDGADSENRF